ncbi:hypothetical protein FACS189497_13930 [Betaproteobacteria bacterium]|nr:hypothetical protein FACS189497_13930 [Betaproteobacteria bacterium]
MARNEMDTPTVLQYNQQVWATCATRNTVAMRYLMLWKMLTVLDRANVEGKRRTEGTSA